MTFSNFGYKDATDAAKDGGAYFYAFGETPEVYNAFYIGLKEINDSGALDKRITISIYLSENNKVLLCCFPSLSRMDTLP